MLYLNILVKGTRLLIMNCNRIEVIEALVFNVEIFCLPYRDDQYYVAEGLKLNYFDVQKAKIGEDWYEYCVEKRRKFKTALSFAENMMFSDDEHIDDLPLAISLRSAMYDFENKFQFNTNKLFEYGIKKILKGT
ncbi:unnamed protein product [Meloidogyne enterolobii]|uniref:Uncharacterized protein n=1 Tax=Meloidogyne enterolobii TaxID=390850 RepID=A0ACB1AY35_MELEN